MIVKERYVHTFWLKLPSTFSSDASLHLLFDLGAVI